MIIPYKNYQIFAYHNGSTAILLKSMD